MSMKKKLKITNYMRAQERLSTDGRTQELHLSPVLSLLAGLC
jgi:hypothetical protein